MYVLPQAPHVLALLHFRRHRAPAAGARQQPHKGVLPLGGAAPRLAAQDGLHLLERIVRDERFMRALATLPAPHEVARVDGVPEHAVDFTLRHAAIAAPMS